MIIHPRHRQADKETEKEQICTETNSHTDKDGYRERQKDRQRDAAGEGDATYEQRGRMRD